MAAMEAGTRTGYGYWVMGRVHYKSNVKKLIYYRAALKEPSQVVLNRVKKLHFVYPLQAGDCNFFTSCSHNLGRFV